MKAAILGANGFVGSHLAQAMIVGGHEVWAFVRSSATRIPEGCRTVQDNSTEAQQVLFDVVYISIGNYALTAEQFEQQRLFLENWLASHSFRRVVYVSSVAVYGNHTTTISVDTEPLAPGLYGQSKLREEAVVVRCSSYAIARFTYLYGTGMGNNSFIPRITHDALHKRAITLLGTGAREQDYLHIDDAIRLLLELGSVPANGIALGVSGTSYSNAEVAARIAKEAGNAAVNYEGVDAAPSVKFKLTSSSWYNWQPSVAFTAGIQHYVAHEMAHL